MDDAKGFIDSLVEKGSIEADIQKYMKPNDLVRFQKTELYRRMEKALSRELLFREQPFIIEKEARTLNKDWDSDEMVLVQGIIDAFFHEEDGIVILDYKTDHVKDPEDLKDRYAFQLNLYADALEKLTGRAIKEKLLYSVTFGKVLRLE